MPAFVLLAPIAGRLPAFRLHDRPAIRQPQRRRRIAAGRDEFQPFGVADEMTRDAHLRDQFVVPRRFVVEAEAVALVANGMNAGRHIDIDAARANTSWNLRSAGRLPVRVISRIGRVLREGVQDVGDQQFLVLLFVMQADLENLEYARRVRRRHGLDQPLDRLVDMGTIAGDILAVRAGDQAALRARMARAGGDVIGVEQEGKTFVENRVGRVVRHKQELLEKPGDMGAVPFGRRGIRHRLHDLVFRRQMRGARLGFRPHAAKCLAPAPTRFIQRRLGGFGSLAGIPREGRSCRKRHGKAPALGKRHASRFT